MEKESSSFVIRAKTPADFISLKDELNKSGIVPLGRFELVEDIVRLNQQTAEQSGSASAVIGVLAVLLAVIIFAMTSILRKREYAIYKVSGYGNGHLALISMSETITAAVSAAVLMLAASPLLDMAAKAMFHASILSAGKLSAGVLLISAVSVTAFAAGLPAIYGTSYSAMLKAGDKS